PNNECESDLYFVVEEDANDTDRYSSDSQQSYEAKLKYLKEYNKEYRISIYNRGPTEAAGVVLKFKYHGNVNIYLRQGLNEIELDRVYPGLVDPASGVLRPSKTVMLPIGYAPEGGYATPTALNISLRSGTLDVNPSNNDMNITFTMVNVPNIRISIASSLPFSEFVYDNRTKPSDLPLGDQRIGLTDIGPMIKHAYQIEHIGDAGELEDVTISIKVPISLKPYSQYSKYRADYLLYLFNNVYQPGNDGHEIPVRPRVIQFDGSGGFSKIADCIAEDPEIPVVNQRGLTAIDTKATLKPGESFTNYPHHWSW
ncbi:hypothetical protein Ciccas_009767, partial [Cichlidogyrus casuarinus]